ncbi:MAG: hypothetical protein ACP5N6_15765 [Anaerolineae bacterium]|jgi:hypothetical protein|uniref:hypothetical protein n=1 Tax=Thermogutta sp. TaxID=1962930 RepID=UPI00321F7AD8
MNFQNLDQLCALLGYEMAQKVNAELSKASDTENMITKSLGVLQEDGVYAFFLYLASQIKEKKGDKKDKRSNAASALANQAAQLLKHQSLNLIRADDGENVYEKAMEEIRRENGLASDLDRLLLAKRVLEQALIYARYHAKALE